MTPDKRLELEPSQGQLQSLVQFPFERVYENALGGYDRSALETLVENGIAEYLGSPENLEKGASVLDMQKTLDMDARKLTIVLRYLATEGWVRETQEGVFSLNRPGLELLKGRGGRRLFRIDVGHRVFVAEGECGGRREWVGVGCVVGGAWVVGTMMLHKSGVLKNLPIDTIGGEIRDRLLASAGGRMQAAGSVLNHAEEEELSGTRCGLASDAQAVGVPALGPFGRVLVDGVQEETMYEPDVGGAISVEVITALEIHEERFPVATKAIGDIIP